MMKVVGNVRLWPKSGHQTAVISLDDFEIG